MLLNLFREDVLSTFSDDYVLYSALEIEIAILVQHAQVTSPEEAIIGEQRSVGFLILIISLRAARSRHSQLPYAEGVGFEYSCLDFREDSSNGLHLEGRYRIKCENRTSLGKTITLNKVYPQSLLCLESLWRKRPCTGNASLQIHHSQRFPHRFAPDPSIVYVKQLSSAAIDPHKRPEHRIGHRTFRPYLPVCGRKEFIVKHRDSHR